MYVCMSLKSEKILKNPENLNLVSYKIITPGFVYVFCSPKNNCRDMALCLTKTWKQKCYFDYIYIRIDFLCEVIPYKIYPFLLPKVV